ncbi:hypothetical protein L6164_025227 [Bauhinia variegata]|uniref:Uncharacterized protein n=1 Tax=Bauhinia variegata TaxID=167791 RepID=A0ACB9LZP8_BAUVA|nr:hypothetical protein L6164_025227 [Bauhinia variegata]
MTINKSNGNPLHNGAFTYLNHFSAMANSMFLIHDKECRSPNKTNNDAKKEMPHRNWIGHLVLGRAGFP